jgi:hypothetical protein
MFESDSRLESTPEIEPSYIENSNSDDVRNNK